MTLGEHMLVWPCVVVAGSIAGDAVIQMEPTAREAGMFLSGVAHDYLMFTIAYNWKSLKKRRLHENDL